jgi:hypothetical protein
MESAVSRLLSWFIAYAVEPLVGVSAALPASVAHRWPELTAIRWRRGGLAPRMGGWCLGTKSVAGITLWQTVFLAPDAPWDPPLLLHERRHAEQFSGSMFFPVLYIWESLRRGYSRNRFEVDANAWAALRCQQHSPANLQPGA